MKGGNVEGEIVLQKYYVQSFSYIILEFSESCYSILLFFKIILNMKTYLLIPKHFSHTQKRLSAH